MNHYERTYATARSIFTVLEFVGWALVIMGGLGALIGFATGGMFGFLSRGDPPFVARVISTLPGLAFAVGGLFAVANVQSSRANVDQAEMSREMLALMKSAKQPRVITPLSAVSLVQENAIQSQNTTQLAAAQVGKVRNDDGNEILSVVDKSGATRMIEVFDNGAARVSIGGKWMNFKNSTQAKGYLMNFSD